MTGGAGGHLSTKSRTITMADLMSGRSRAGTGGALFGADAGAGGGGGGIVSVMSRTGARSLMPSRTELTMRGALRMQQKDLPQLFDPREIRKLDWVPWDRRMRSNALLALASFVHDKFLEEQSPLAVNISYGTRKEVYHAFRKLNLKSAAEHGEAYLETLQEEEVVYDEAYLETLTSLFVLFDTASAEVFKLLQTDAWSRFKSSSVYQRFRAAMNPDSARKAEQLLLEELNQELKRVAALEMEALRNQQRMLELAEETA